MTITVITNNGCASCGKVLKEIEELQPEFPNMNIETIGMSSDEGQKLVAEHSILASPGVLIEGKLAFFGPKSKEEMKSILTASMQ